MKRKRFRSKDDEELEQPQRRYNANKMNVHELNEARHHIKKLCKRAKFSKKFTENYLSMQLGWEFEMRKINSIDEARNIYRLLRRIEINIADLRQLEKNGFKPITSSE